MILPIVAFQLCFKKILIEKHHFIILKELSQGIGQNILIPIVSIPASLNKTSYFFFIIQNDLSQFPLRSHHPFVQISLPHGRIPHHPQPFHR